MKGVFITTVTLIVVFMAATGLGLIGRRTCPVEVPTGSPTDTVRTLSILFGGDLMQHLPQVEAARTPNGFNYDDCFVYVKPMFDTTDVVVVNLETTLTYKPNYSGYPCFRSPVELAAAMKRAGVNVAVCANNHTCDNGLRGIKTTIRALDSLGIAHTGAFDSRWRAVAESPLYVERNGIKLAIINCTYGTNGLPVPKGATVNHIDTMKIKDEIRRALLADADFTFVVPHWGEEYARHPNKEQQLFAEMCHREGAQLVIGSHPHVIQPFETQRDSLGNVLGATVYSLGNFVSAQTKEHTDGGLTVRFVLSVTDSGIRTIEPQYMLVWRYKPHFEGRTVYRILPSPVGDTLQLSAWQRKVYDDFMESSHKLIGNRHGFQEIE